MRARNSSSRLVCASNLKGLGTSAKIYANDNGGTWPIPAFDESAAIDYRVPVGGGVGSVQSPSRSQQSLSVAGGANELSVSRALWMLVRNGEVTVRQLICPQSDDVQDPTEKLDAYYDFGSSANLSYGFQVPFGPASTRARFEGDNRMILAADKGPYIDASMQGPPPGLNHETIKLWKPYNTRHHSSDGQCVFFADGHTEFKHYPTVGIDSDNIYTIALDNYNLPSRTIGELPWLRSLPPQSSTDSVIFP